MIGETNFSALKTLEEVKVLELFATAVDSARYWQEPDEIDVLLTNRELSELLRPVEEALRSNPISNWLAEDIALGKQVYVDWSAVGSAPPVLSGTATILQRWTETADHLGGWWSPPLWAPTLDEASRMAKPRPMLTKTSRGSASLGAIGLLLEEDNFGTPGATCRPVTPTARPRVFEIASAERWRELVERHPIDVTKGHTAWSLASGRSGQWLLPDWSRIAEEFDVIHLPAARYLALSGVPIELGSSAASLIAGWNPDESFWLNDVLVVDGPPTEWEADSSNPPRGWHPASAAGPVR